MNRGRRKPDGAEVQGAWRAIGSKTAAIRLRREGSQLCCRKAVGHGSSCNDRGLHREGLVDFRVVVLLLNLKLNENGSPNPSSAR
jgi:hypothetical protein